MPVQSEMRKRSVHDKQLARKRKGSVNVELVSASGGGTGTGLTIDDVQQRVTGCRVVATSDIAVDETTTAVDGVTLTDQDVVLKADPTPNTENSAWVVSTTGDWTRIDDVDANTHFAVSEGDAYANTLWRVTTPAPIAVGTTEIGIGWCGKLLPRVLAHYAFDSQSISIAAGDYDSIDIDLATAVIVSADVTDTTPFTYEAAADQIVDVSATVVFAPTSNLSRYVLALNVSTRDAVAVFVPNAIGGSEYMHIHERLTLHGGDVLKLVLRSKNTGGDAEDLTISAAEIIISTT